MLSIYSFGLNEKMIWYCLHGAFFSRAINCNDWMYTLRKISLSISLSISLPIESRIICWWFFKVATINRLVRLLYCFVQFHFISLRCITKFPSGATDQWAIRRLYVANDNGKSDDDDDCNGDINGSANIMEMMEKLSMCVLNRNDETKADKHTHICTQQ